MINKRIFYVWGVDEPKKRDVLACMQTWRQVCPDYEIIEINEDSVKYFNFKKELKENTWFRSVYNRKMWAFVADYIRIKVLYDNGGIYLDTDVSVLKKFDNFLNTPAFVGMQDNKIDGGCDYTEPAVLGSKKGNVFLKNILNFYNEKIWQEPIYTMPQIFKYFLDKENCPEFKTKAQQKIIKLKDIYIYPEKYFIPFRFMEEYTPECVEKDTHTIHWFGGSWVKPEILHFLNHKHLNSNICQKEIELTKIYKIKIFGITFLLVKEKSKDNFINKVYYLFKIIPFLFSEINSQMYILKLFNILPLIRIKKTKQKTKIYILGFIPFRKKEIYNA